MKILAGEMPRGTAWRTLVLLEPGAQPGPIWQFGRDVAHANGGEPVVAVVVPEAQNESLLLAARETLERAREEADSDRHMHALLIETRDFGRAIRQIIDRSSIDLLLADATGNWRGLERLPCAIGLLRGGSYAEFHEEPEDNTISSEVMEPTPANRHMGSILVPTSAGPNSAHALSFVLPLAPRVRITALYVAPTYLGHGEEALGRSRLQQMLRFIDAGENVEGKLTVANSVTEGIIEEARQGYDLVLIGASRESTLDKAIFGDVVGSVVRQSLKPVIVVREPNNRLGSLARGVAWRLRNVLPRLEQHERSEVYVRVRRGARPNADFFILIGLSTLIAAFGLLLSSPAVVIGAMLVAPLMSPMVGVGMATVLGDTRFLRLSLGAVMRGVALSVVLGAVAGLTTFNMPLTNEILSRTQPNLLDLGVALFAGLAGAYALTDSDAAAALPGVAISAALVPPLAAAGIAFSTLHFNEGLGALLLFVANFAAIVFASVMVFLLRGFRPSQSQKARRNVQTRSVQAATVMLLVVAAVLGYFTIRLTQNQRALNTIEQVVGDALVEVANAELSRLEIHNLSDPNLPLSLDIVAEADHNVPFVVVEELQEQVAATLQPILDEGKEVQLVLTVIRVTRLDPVAPPTATPTASPSPSATATETPGPPPSTTNTATASPTSTVGASPSATVTVMPTSSPTATGTPTPAILRAQVVAPFGVNLREAPGANATVIAIVPDGAVVELLPEQETVGTTIWQKIRYGDLDGWVVASVLSAIDG